MRSRTSLCASIQASKGITIAHTPFSSSKKWSYQFSLFWPFFIASEHIAMVLGRDPKIEAARKADNASAKSMNKRGTRDTPPNHPTHRQPQTCTKKRKQNKRERNSKPLGRELDCERTYGSKLSDYPPTNSSSEDDKNSPSDDESVNKSTISTYEESRGAPPAAAVSGRAGK
jgi:hypothetical protein